MTVSVRCVRHSSTPTTMRLSRVSIRLFVCFQVRKLRRAYDMADVDGDNELEKRELEIVMLSLDPSGTLTDDDMNHVWETLNYETKGFLTWGAFLRGMGKVHEDPRATNIMNKDSPNKFELVSLLIDIKVSAREEQELMDSLSFLEKFGMRSLKSMQKPMMQGDAKAVLRKASMGELHKLDTERQGAIFGAQILVACQAFLIGAITNALPGMWENYLTWDTQSDGMYDTYQSPNCFTRQVNATVIENVTLWAAEAVTICEVISPFGTLAYFWGLLIPVMLVFMVMEILLLGMAAVRASCNVSFEYDFRLTPLNKERHFVATALIRACFEMGNAPQRSYGVNPDQVSRVERSQHRPVFRPRHFWAAVI